MPERNVIPVTLTTPELALGVIVGCLRQVVCIGKGMRFSPEFDPGKDNPWLIHFEGGWGEIATAKGLHRYWSPTINEFKRGRPDIEPDIEVRARIDHRRDLKVKQDDVLARRFVLVTGEPPDFKLRGWLRGSDAARDEW